MNEMQNVLGLLWLLRTPEREHRRARLRRRTVPARASGFVRPALAPPRRRAA